jgi:hypothetical protein
VPLSLAGRRNFRFDQAWNRVVATFATGDDQAAPAATEVASSRTAHEPDDEVARDETDSIAPPLIRIIHEADGQWTVSSASHHYRGNFVDLKSALGFARQTYGDEPATLWLSVDGLVVVIPQEAGWPRSVIGDAR